MRRTTLSLPPWSSCFTWLVPTAAVAGERPANDTEGGAIEIGSLPFTHSMDTSGATADGPRFCESAAWCSTRSRPMPRAVQVDLIGSEFDTTLGIYTYRDDGEVRFVTCNDDRFGLASGVRFRAVAGVTYFLMVGAYDRGDGGPLVLTAGNVSDTTLEYEVEVTGGTTDPATGLATVTGTVTCNERSAVYREATLRQVRQGIFVARGASSPSARRAYPDAPASGRSRSTPTRASPSAPVRPWCGPRSSPRTTVGRTSSPRRRPGRHPHPPVIR